MPSQRAGEHYAQTLVVKSLAQQRQELFNDSLPGGIMSGYLEPGFPFYFINRQMLRYLGYESQEAFVAHNKGRLDNCAHPEDWERVSRAILEQLA